MPAWTLDERRWVQTSSYFGISTRPSDMENDFSESVCWWGVFLRIFPMVPTVPQLRWAWRAPLSPDRLAARLWRRHTSVAAQGVDPSPTLTSSVPTIALRAWTSAVACSALARCVHTHVLGCFPPTHPPVGTGLHACTASHLRSASMVGTVLHPSPLFVHVPCPFRVSYIPTIVHRG